MNSSDPGPERVAVCRKEGESQQPGASLAPPRACGGSDGDPPLEDDSSTAWLMKDVVGTSVADDVDVVRQQLTDLT